MQALNTNPPTPHRYSIGLTLAKSSIRSVFFSFSSEIMDADTVSGAIPICITVNMPTKK